MASPSAPVGPGSFTPPHMCAALSTPGSVTKMPFQLSGLRMIAMAASAAQTSPPSWAASWPVT